MDPLIVGFQPATNQGLVELHSRLDMEFTARSVEVVQAWDGDSADYFVVSAGPSVGQLQNIAASANAALTGIARLVFDVGEQAEGGITPAAAIVRPSPGVDISLPSPASDSLVDAEKFVCPKCGGINEHFSPPH